MPNEEHAQAVVDTSNNEDTTTSFEWAQTVQTIELSPEALAKVLELIDAAPRPCSRLREAAKRQRQKR